MTGDGTASYDDPAEELPAEMLRRLKIVVPGYKLLKERARGGQAVVYKALQESTDMIVAVKLLRDGVLADSSSRERLKREARVLATLKLPNIAALIDSGETPDGHLFLAMQFIDGEPLDRFFPDFGRGEHSSLEPSFFLQMFLKICDAVSAAHSMGITHRDLSPSNILVNASHEPFVVDFGLARTAFDRFFHADRRDISVSNQFMGKVAYASPEQARGKSAQIDPRTDVYSLGVILYQILTGGEFPYEVVGSIADVLHNIIHAQPTPLNEAISIKASLLARQLRVHLPDPPRVNPVIEAIVLKALEKKPELRYRSAGQMADDIRNYLAGQPTIARIVPRPPTRTNPWRGRLGGIAAAVLLVASIGIFLFAVFWLLRTTGSPGS